jgi:hypothetical protein
MSKPLPNRIYILGPMRHHSGYNFPAFDAVARQLRSDGWDVINPADLDRKEGFDPSKLPPTHDWSKFPEDSLDLHDTIRRDVDAVRTCGAFWSLTGWEKSLGARAEKALLEWQGAIWVNAPTAPPETRVPITDRALRMPAALMPPESKPSNPKDAVGSNKLPFHLFPETAVALGSLAFLEGALKYGRANWRVIGVRTSIYIDALRRHVNAYFEGEDLDPDSGLPHLSHALACLAIIVDAQAAGKLTDDRQVSGGYRRMVNWLTPHVKRLKELHADKSPTHFTIADSKANLVSHILERDRKQGLA